MLSILLATSTIGLKFFHKPAFERVLNLSKSLLLGERIQEHALCSPMAGLVRFSWPTVLWTGPTIPSKCRTLGNLSRSSRRWRWVQRRHRPRWRWGRWPWQSSRQLSAPSQQSRQRSTHHRCRNTLKKVRFLCMILPFYKIIITDVEKFTFDFLSSLLVQWISCISDNRRTKWISFQRQMWPQKNAHHMRHHTLVIFSCAFTWCDSLCSEC